MHVHYPYVYLISKQNFDIYMYIEIYVKDLSIDENIYIDIYNKK